jgi:hypothetical protein
MPINLPIPLNTSTISPVGMFDSASGTSGSNELNKISSEIKANIFIGGLVFDDQNNPLPGVNITFTQTPGIKTEFNGVILPIVDNITTNTNGEWSLTYPRTEIDLKYVKIIFLKQDYKTENISNPVISDQYPTSTDPISAIKTSTPDTEPPYEYKVGNKIFKSEDQNIAKKQATDYALKANNPKYKGATIVNIKKTLYKSPKLEDSVKSFVQPIIDEINKLENDENYEQNKQEFSFQEKATITFNIEKESLKRKLIPFIIRLLYPFGVAVIQAVLAKIPLENIKDQILCPRQDKILELINKRNKLVRQINNIYKKTSKIEKTLTTTNSILTGVQFGIVALQFNPYPVPSVIVSKLIGLEDELKKVKITVNILTLTLAAFGAVLGIVLGLLNALDFLLQECAQSQDISYDIINNELNILVNQSTGISNSDVIQSIQEDNTYRGFTLEIKFDTTNSNKYPKRFAQALTKTGIPVLKTDSSFASDPQVLLDQLKFIIDSNPQLTAE